MYTATRWRHDVFVAGEIPDEERLRAFGFLVTAGIGHRLAAAGLIERVIDAATEPFEQLKGGHTHLRLEGVHVTGYEKTNSHPVACSMI
jgi:hypothetical protein